MILEEDESCTNALVDNNKEEEVDIKPALRTGLTVTQSPVVQILNNYGKLSLEELAE